jgi:hypothetical protein
MIMELPYSSYELFKKKATRNIEAKRADVLSIEGLKSVYNKVSNRCLVA